ncbi:protein-export chaperone SecB [Candidatus Pollutiaquabacter sp.]|uniref:protein-export chaperone SecB n=1 Tax=Candidatus Pollutiaquabacter sp. TaxID=3416354 RepID=UPI003C829F33|nr:protein-export chaperone SecB [Bacteroidota bacterium]
MNTGYQPTAIWLLSSQLDRDEIIDFKKELSVTPNIDYSVVINEKEILCKLFFSVSFKIEDQEVATMSCTFGGSFNVIGQPKLSTTDFANVNAPSIIFPFIREHVASTAVKAGLGPLILPPVNFVDFALKKKKSSNQ